MTDLILPEGGGVLQSPLWVNGFWVSIPGAVKSKSNYRHSTEGRKKWGLVKDFEDKVFIYSRSYIPENWDCGDEGSKVADRPKVIAVLIARSTLDSGNLSKSVLDALEGELFISDAQVAACTDMVYRTGKEPGLLAAFVQVEAGSSFETILNAQHELTSQVKNLFDL